MQNELTAARVRELLDYDPETGVFRWKVARRGGVKAGAVAGHMDSRGKYWVIGVDGRERSAGRLAWLYITGEWPLYEIDHNNRDKLCNRFENLRDATRGQNQSNKRGWSSSGLKGAYWDRTNKTWFSKIWKDRKQKKLGNFSSAEEAHAAYCEAANRLHTSFACTGHRDGGAA